MRGAPSRPKTCREPILSVKAGHIVTVYGETYPAVDLAVTTDRTGYGVIIEPLDKEDVSSYTIDTAITDALYVIVLKLPLPPGVHVLVFLEATAGPVAMKKGEPLAIGTEAGKTRSLLYADATEATDSTIEKLGTIQISTAGDASNDLIVPMGA